MSFTYKTASRAFQPGYFLADHNVTRETHQMNQSKAKTAANGGKYIPAGTVWPTNDTNAVGIVYQDVDVTAGDMPGSVVTAGIVYEDRLPEALNSAARTTLKGKGFVFVTTAPKATRPY